MMIYSTATQHVPKKSAYTQLIARNSNGFKTYTAGIERCDEVSSDSQHGQSARRCQVNQTLNEPVESAGTPLPKPNGKEKEMRRGKELAVC